MKVRQFMNAWISRAMSLGFLLSLGSGRALATYTQPPPCNNPFTPQQEVNEGAKVAAQVYQQMPVLPDSDPVSRYVAQLGAHLVSHAPGLKWPFNYHVVASSDVNAFALPGGSIFINLGTIQAADTEAQLAGVLAHETSHVVLRHSTCNMKKQQTTNLLAGIGGLASRILLGDGTAGQLGQTIVGAGNGLYGLRMSRDNEKQADLLGTDILYNSGYDPRGMPQFFEIIQAKYGAGGAQLLTDHPNPGNRAQYVDAEIATLPQRTDPVVTSAAFTRAHSLALQQRTYTAAQITSGAWKNGNYTSGPGQSGNGQYSAQTNPSASRQGSDSAGYPAAGQVSSGTGQYGAEGPMPLTPSQLGEGARMVTVRGQHFQINAPAGWQAAPGTNGSTSVAPVGGAGTFGMVYGAVIGMAQADSVHDEDALANATQQLAQQISKENGGLRQLTQVQSIDLSGRIAEAVEMRGRSPLLENGSSLPEHDWLIVFPSNDGDLHYIVFVAPERDLARLRPTFVAMMNSFKAQ